MEKYKQHIPLIVGLGIPVVMVLFIALLTYAPRVFNPIDPPKYDFIYAAGDGVAFGKYPGAVTYPSRGVWPSYRYTVENGTLVKKENPRVPGYENYPIEDVAPKFYIYRVGAKESLPISFEEAQAFKLDDSPKSPDSFEVVRGSGRSGGDFLFFGTPYDYNKWYIEKEYYSEELNLNLPRDYYQETFVAWVMQ